MSAFSIPPTVDAIIVALCADYERRAALIHDPDISLRTSVEYRYLNYKISEAAKEVVGEGVAKMYVDEIGEKRGYAKSDIYGICEVTYKVAKREIKHNIARKLHLID